MSCSNTLYLIKYPTISNAGILLNSVQRRKQVNGLF